MNNNTIRNFFILTLSLIVGSCGGDGNGAEDKGSGSIELPGALSPQAVVKTNPMKVYAHYMPWFETPQSNNGQWGWHWTMNNCTPNQTDANGKRDIASHYYPLIGPYASSDATVLNYHALLMKYTGIDGVMIDWYGTQDKNDYASNRTNTEAIVKAMTRAGLQVAIVYEDATLSGLDTDGKVVQAQRDMRYLQNNFFGLDNYVKIENSPLLMVFGPQQLEQPANWTSAFSILASKPAFVVLNNFSSKANGNGHTNAIGEFLWVNPNPDYNVAKQFDCYIGGAMPGFYDYYKEGGAGEGYTTYPHEDGALFSRQLQAAKTAGLDYLQISTWNDFGEGTTIEPTDEYGYRYLTVLQQFVGVTYQESILKSIYRWYELKVQHAGSQSLAADYLTQAYYYFIALQPDKAIALLDQVDQL